MFNVVNSYIRANGNFSVCSFFITSWQLLLIGSISLALFFVDKAEFLFFVILFA